MKFDHTFWQNMRDVAAMAWGDGEAWNFCLLKGLRSYNIVNLKFSLPYKENILCIPKNIESLFIVSADFLKAGLIKHIYNVGIGLFQMVQCGLLCVILKTNAYGELK